MEEKILTVKEMAAILHIKPNTIHGSRWKEKSGCPLIKRGKRLFCFAEDFSRWFKDGLRG